MSKRIPSSSTFPERNEDHAGKQWHNLGGARNPLSAIGGALLSSVFGGLFGIGSTLAQNAYNSPRAQLRRLRKAGLPLAYMYQGRVNQQSDVPKLSIDPDLGAVEQQNINIAKGQLHETQRMNDQDIQNLKEALEQMSISNQIKQGELDWYKEKHPDTEGTGLPRTNQALMMDLEKSIKNSQDWINTNRGRVAQIVADVEDKFALEEGQLNTKKEALNQIVNRVAVLASQDKVLGQLYNIRQIQEVLNKTSCR